MPVARKRKVYMRAKLAFRRNARQHIAERLTACDGLPRLHKHAGKPRIGADAFIRLPDFVTKADFDWAVEEATSKKKTDFSRVEFLTYDEGLCVQCMHIGPYDNEPATVELMHQFMSEQGYALDITDLRYHHEIYLSDARKTAPDKLKTVIRHPIKKV